MRALSLGALGGCLFAHWIQPVRRAVKGHPFGLDLNAQDKKAIIAFLKTLWRGPALFRSAAFVSDSSEKPQTPRARVCATSVLELKKEALT